MMAACYLCGALPLSRTIAAINATATPIQPKTSSLTIRSFNLQNCGCPALAFFARAGTMRPVLWGWLCPAACIAPTALITCTLSLPRATGDYLFLGNARCRGDGPHVLPFTRPRLPHSSRFFDEWGPRTSKIIPDSCIVED